MVAAIPDDDYKTCSYRSSLSPISISSLFSLLNDPFIRVHLEDDDMNSPDKKRSPVKPAMSPSNSTSSAPPATTSNSHQRNLSSALRRLPRKASRLICIADKSGSRTSAAIPKEHGGGMPASQHGDRQGGSAKYPSAAERPSSENSSGSDPASSGHNTSNSRVLSPSSSASSILDGSGVVAQSDHHMLRRECLEKPIIPLSELVEALEKDMHISSRSYGTKPQQPHSPGISHDMNFPAEFVHEDPIPRPLSPPNAHFRRRRVLSGSGPGLGPYTTPSPIGSPPGSPAPDTTRIFLNDLLSNESLVVSQRPRLYNGAEERDDEDNDCRSIMSDVGMNAYTPAFSHEAIVAPRPAPGGTPSLFQHSLGSKRRSCPRVPMMEPQSTSGQDEYALRRVFSR